MTKGRRKSGSPVHWFRDGKGDQERKNVQERGVDHEKKSRFDGQGSLEKLENLFFLGVPKREERYLHK